MESSRFIENRLTTIDITKRENAKTILSQLQQLLASALNTIEAHYPTASESSDSHDSLYTGCSGLSLTYLRVSQQLPALCLPGLLARKETVARLAKKHMPRLSHHRARVGRVPPLGGTHGPSIVEIFRQLLLPDSASNKQEDDRNWRIALENVKDAIALAEERNEDEANEVLYGRAGLLWALANIKSAASRCSTNDPEKAAQLQELASKKVCKAISRRIIKAGILGAKEYEQEHGQAECPLMWKWHDKFYLGAIHGTSGILTILFQCGYGASEETYSTEIVETAKQLDVIAAPTGHLPSSLPAKKRSYNLVQICHGTPGLLALHALSNTKHIKPLQVNTTSFNNLSGAVWEEGLVRKGLGICHGLAGNAYPWLLDGASDSATSAESLARAISFLQATQSCPPLGDSGHFRTPDHPYSLFEGLAGTICAISDACAILHNRFVGEGERVPVFGISGIGGNGVQGLL